MSKYIGNVWECDNCNSWGKSQPWKCPVCKKETCDNCFDSYCVCNECAKHMTQNQMRDVAIKEGYFPPLSDSYWEN